MKPLIGCFPYPFWGFFLVSRAFFGQLFDAPAEIVIAQGRVVLAAISLTGIAIDPTEPREFSGLVQVTLILYALYAVSILAALHWRVIEEVGGKMMHSVDIAIVGVLLVITDGFSSPFLVFFTFVLLAASLRWDWEGIVVTIAVLVLLASVVAVIEFLTVLHKFDLNQTIIRAAYLIVTGTLLAYSSAHREHERSLLTKLAQWPATAPAEDPLGPLTDTLQRAVSVLGNRRALVAWEEREGRGRTALLADGRCEMFYDGVSTAGQAVAPELATHTFSRTLPDLNVLNLLDGRPRRPKDAFDEDFLAKFHIADFSSAPFQGIVAKGRLFLLENIRRSDDHLLITSIVADRVGAELDRQIFLEEAAEIAAARERASIMRDLHDGLLQNLTAARVHLELLATDEKDPKARLQIIRELLRIEQRRIRQFVDEIRAGDTELVALGSLRSFTDETARFWGCEVGLRTEPDEARVPRKTVNQLSLLIAEAVANAVRHGRANCVQARVSCDKDRIHIEVWDDGHGFAHRPAVGEPVRVSDQDLPRSLHERITELGGGLRVWTSAAGTRLQFEFSL